MSNAYGARSLALVTVIILVTLALLAIGAAAEEFHSDLTINGEQERTGETITITGVLTVDWIGSLKLTDCDLIFTGGTADDVRIRVTSGSLVLNGTDITAENGGHMYVDGHLEMTGDSIIENMDILVQRNGVMVVKDADLTLRGSYNTPVDNDPLKLHVEGTATFTDSAVTLMSAFISSDDTFTFIRSSLDATHDFGRTYDRLGERFRLDGGTATLTDSTFTSLFMGIHSRADLSATGCTFSDADLDLFAPWWHVGLTALVDNGTFYDSDLTVGLEESNRETKEVDVLVRAISLQGGNLEIDLKEAYTGNIHLDTVSMDGFTGYGVVVKARGIDGDLILEGLDIDGPWGVQVLHDYSGLQLIDSVIKAQQTALDFGGTSSSIPAYLDNLDISGSNGLKAQNTVLFVTDSDLSSATVPVLVQSGAAMTLTDCLLEEADIQLDVQPGGKPATVKVDRHLDIGTVKWTIGDPIEEGSVSFFVYAEETLYPVVRQWSVGSDNIPLIRLLEWSMDDSGGEERLVFNDVKPSINIAGTTFEPEETFTLDPWDAGPFDLTFLDDVSPWLLVSGAVDDVINDPDWVLHGTLGDEGTGIDHVTWELYTAFGELVDTGDVEYLSEGRWQTTITVTADMQVVHLIPWDRTGNDDVVPLQAVRVIVPAPTLTVIRPESGAVTTVSFVTVSGLADFYANIVNIQVLGYPDELLEVPVVAGQFSKIFQLPHEGVNELIITSNDPYGGWDEKRVFVTLDSLPPQVTLDDLVTDSINYRNNPSLVISGTTDDPSATIIVLGQEVGLVNDRFVTTVSLANGDQTIKVRAIDEAGNENLVNLQVVLDTDAPKLTLINPSEATFWSIEYEVDVKVRVDEPLSASTVNDDPIEVVEGLMTHTAMLGNDPYTVTFRVIDRAGNEAEITVVLRHDDDAPLLDPRSPTDGQIVKSTAVPLIVVTDEVGCRLTVDGVPLEISGTDTWTLTGTMYLPRGEGKRTITLTIFDRAGNSETMDLELDIDTVYPSISLPGITEGMKITTEPLKVKGFTEPDSKVVWVNGKMATLAPNGDFSSTIHPEEGWQEIKVEVLDRAGNYAVHKVNVKALGEPSFDPPFEILAGATILATLGALAISTEAGRWGMLSFLVPLYTKLRKDKILDQRTRGMIEGYITANPGCNYTIIRDNLSLADGTLTYHLQVLEREGFIYSIREGLFRCFYPQGVPPPRRGKLHLSDTQADIVRITKRIPGITVGEIATAMNRRPNVISYHLKLLREGGLIRMEEDGRHVRVYPIDTAVAMI
jgi:DNA-binding transcriptional ArsR family regulator